MPVIFGSCKLPGANDGFPPTGDVRLATTETAGVDPSGRWSIAKTTRKPQVLREAVKRRGLPPKSSIW
jgi:hypothetical protein